MQVCEEGTGARGIKRERKRVRRGEEKRRGRDGERRERGVEKRQDMKNVRIYHFTSLDYCVTV